MAVSKIYPYRQPLNHRITQSFRYFFASILEYCIFVLPLPPKLALFIHQLRGVRFKDRSTVFIRPLVQLASRFPDDLIVGRNVFFDLGAVVLPDRFVPEAPQHSFERTQVVIEDNVYIGMGAIILSGVTVHTGAVIASGAVVYEDVPAHSMVRGNPAKVIKTLPLIDRSASAPALPEEETIPDDDYDENGVSRKSFPYEQDFLKTLKTNPGILFRSLLTYAILTLPVPPRLATRLYKWMGVNFLDWKTSGIVIPIFMDPINPTDITFGKCSHVSSHSIIAAHFFDPYHPGFYYRRAKVAIGDNVFLGMGVIIAAPVNIGAYSVASASSIIFRDIKNNMGVIGNPARAFVKTPSLKRDYEIITDKDKKFYDDSGKSEDIYHFEHRLGEVLKEDPMRIVNFLLDYFATLLPFPSSVKASIHRLWGIQIKDPKSIQLGSAIYLERLAPKNISIGRNVTLGDRVRLLAHYPEGTVEGCFYRTGKVTVEDDVFIGASSVIANNVTIGRGAVIMPGTLIVSDIPPMTIVGGFPTEVLGRRTCIFDD